MGIKFILVTCCLILPLLLIVGVQGHGRMMDPIGRSSRWRTNSSAPRNDDDNGLYCGGYGEQWRTYGGRCGICGDSYGAPKPRANELGGRYGEGVIVKRYNKENKIDVSFDITANHKGYVYLDFCNLDSQPETEECFSGNTLKLVDGSYRFYVGDKPGSFTTTLLLPRRLRCKHCVLRWTYVAGNNSGRCSNGKDATGCGPQETFKSCADISVNA